MTNQSCHAPPIDGESTDRDPLRDQLRQCRVPENSELNPLGDWRERFVQSPLYQILPSVIMEHLDSQTRDVMLGHETLSFDPDDPVARKRGFGSTGRGVQAVERLVNIVRREGDVELRTSKTPKLRVDGRFDKELNAEVTAHQRIVGLPETGEVDRDTFESLVYRTLEIDARLKRPPGQVLNLVRGALMGRDYCWQQALLAQRNHGVTAPLTMAIINRESAFDPLAISVTNARGLMQLMPETAVMTKVDDPFAPDENIRGGTHWFSDIRRSFGGNNLEALAGYNWGPEYVKAIRKAKSETQAVTQTELVGPPAEVASATERQSKADKPNKHTVQIDPSIHVELEELPEGVQDYVSDILGMVASFERDAAEMMPRRAKPQPQRIQRRRRR